MFNLDIISLIFLAFVTVEAYYTVNSNINYRAEENFLDAVFPNADEGPVEAPSNVPSNCGIFGHDADGSKLDHGVDESHLFPNQVLSVPYQVLVGTETFGPLAWICSAILINDYWALGAAHCLPRIGAEKSYLRLGEKDMDKPTDIPCMKPLDIQIAEIVVHPLYNKSSSFLFNDLVLIRLETTFPKYRHDIRPLCLPWGAEGQRNFVGTEQYQVGRLREDGISSLNVKGVVNLLPPNDCTGILSALNLDGEATDDDFICSNSRQADDDVCMHLTGSTITYRDHQGKVTAISMITAGLNSCPLLGIPLYSTQNLKWIKSVAFKE